MSENEVERAENEHMPKINSAKDLFNQPVQLEIPGHHYEGIEPSVEQTSPGTNHEEMMEMLGGIFVQVSRLYDVMMMTIPVDLRTDILDAHAKGHLLGDPPSLAEDGWG